MMKSSTKMPGNTGFSGVGLDPKASLGGSAGVTYSSIANIPKAKKTKLIQESKPMVHFSNDYRVTVRWS